MKSHRLATRRRASTIARARAKTHRERIRVDDAT